MRTLPALFTAAALALLSACGSGVAEITITGNDEMLFSPQRFTVSAGQTVKLTLKNIGSMPKAGMAHNLVILPRNSDHGAWAARLVPAGASADNNYFPESMRGDAIAFIEEQLGPGESATLEFAAPDVSGTYPFVCTFPGHYIKMNGIMSVR